MTPKQTPQPKFSGLRSRLSYLLIAGLSVIGASWATQAAAEPPQEPSVVTLKGDKSPGVRGGSLNTIFARSKDIRLMTVYSYARLVAYDEALTLQPDILKAFDNEDERVFTFHLRKGHRWSDGAPFTSADFAYYWYDMATNPDLYPFGPPKNFEVKGELPKVEILDELTVRYSWSNPNPDFLSALAGPRPLYIYAPAHYLKRFHEKYGEAEDIEALMKKRGKRNWAGLHHRMNRQYRNDNIKLPVLQPWVNTVKPPAERFVFARNPYFHRVDQNGVQLPYLDEVVINISSAGLVPAKVGAGEVDLQARYLQLEHYPFLKQGEKKHNYRVSLWTNGSGAQLALYPNLNSIDPQWHDLMRNVKFRRALSLGINREEISNVIYYGLASSSNNTVLPTCSLYKPGYQTGWTSYDPKRANAMLDELGLTERNEDGLRLLPNGEPMDIIIHTAGESSEETDVLELVGDSWRQLGIKLHSKPSQREVFRKRVFSGEAAMAMFKGIDNAVPTADMSPREIAPTAQDQLQWPKWGQYYETNNKVGEAPDIPEAMELFELYEQWNETSDRNDREAIWHDMLAINSDQAFSIGIVCGVPQPVVVNNRLQNVPENGSYSWTPTAFFGVYRPDTFWLNDE